MPREKFKGTTKLTSSETDMDTDGAMWFTKNKKQQERQCGACKHKFKTSAKETNCPECGCTVTRVIG